tara:strand:+ start:1677 stop:2534 length:858 start_codon:yes stop_codon:yes gene_type:complete
MAEFLTPENLIKELRKIIVGAESFLMLVSPYIKLHDDIKSKLLLHAEDPNFQLFVLFGKNENNLSKSLSSEDFEFFKQFQNVEIRYVEELHAKYYANENKSIITSLNLHSFSIKNNIEVGVMFEQTLSEKVWNFISEKLVKEPSSDNKAFEYFYDLIENSTSHYKKRANIKSSLFGLIKKQEGNIVEVDNSEKIYSKEKKKEETQKPKSQSGFCIRTGVEIPFNIKEPFSINAFENWSKWKNKDFKEKYCHFSGEETKGETTFSKPVLRKNYTVAMQIQKEISKK